MQNSAGHNRGNDGRRERMGDGSKIDSRTRDSKGARVIVRFMVLITVALMIARLHPRMIRHCRHVHMVHLHRPLAGADFDDRATMRGVCADHEAGWHRNADK